MELWSWGEAGSPVGYRSQRGVHRADGAKGWLPFVHEVRAQLARICGDEATCERERAEAERLWTEMGAHGHIERIARELDELRTRV